MGAILNPTVGEGIYEMEEGTYLPNSIYQTISHPDTVKQLSAAASNFQLLSNGNFLLHAGRQGRTMELTSDDDPVCSDDDFIAPNGIAKSLVFLKENPEYNAVHGKGAMITLDSDGCFGNMVSLFITSVRNYLGFFPNHGVYLLKSLLIF